jgi:hypothetical protein
MTISTMMMIMVVVVVVMMMMMIRRRRNMTMLRGLVQHSCLHLEPFERQCDYDHIEPHWSIMCK